MNTNNFILLLTLLLFETHAAKSNSLTGVQQKHTKELNTSPTSDNPSTEQRLLQMLDRKDFFRLKTQLQEKKDVLPQHIVLYIEANLQNAFNQTEQSLLTIDKLLSNYRKSLSDAFLYRIYAIKYDNLFNQYHYKKAAEALKIAIDKYGHAVDSAELTRSRKEKYDFVNSLRKFPVQKMHITTDVSIPISLNQYNHIILNVSSGEQSENFIFDTGASNIVTESSARRLGIRILESEASIEGAVGKKVQSKVGLADKLWIGDLMFENVVFKVMPDELLTFPAANYVIHGIIGFPVMNQMKEIEIYKNKNINVIANPQKGNLCNLFLDNTLPIVQFEANSDTVLFVLDTGANTSKFSSKYFAAHNTEIKEKATSNTIRREGIGGTADNNVHELKNIPLKIGGQKMTVPTIIVLTDELSYLTNYDGHLGQDILMSFNKLTLNFKEMSLSFDN